MSGAALIVPIGHCVGVRHADAPGDADPVHQVRVGTDLLELPDEQFSVWSLAHGEPERAHDGEPWTRRELATTLGEHPVRAALPELLAARALAEVTPQGNQAVEFARAHRLVPLALGLGGGPEGLGVIGLLYQPLLLLAPALAELWQFAPVSANLWTTCQLAAESAMRADSDEPTRTEPVRVLTGVLLAMHALLASGVACLDLPLGGTGGAS